MNSVVNPCDCDDAKCVCKAVHDENLGLPISDLQSYNAKGNRMCNATVDEMSDQDVYDQDASGIEIKPGNVTLPLGGQVQLSVEPVVFSQNPPVVVWEVSDGKVAMIENGILRALSIGEATVKATDFENAAVSAEITVTVVDPNAQA